MSARPPRVRPPSRRRFLRDSLVVGGGGFAAAVIGGAGQSEMGPDGARAGGPVLDVREFGAIGTGREKATHAIQGAIDAADRLGGGIVRLPAGTWLSGTVRLRSHVTLDLAPGAVLLASRDDGDFAPRERLPFETGSDVETTDFAHALLVAQGAEQVGITGAGVIDMNRVRRFGPKPIGLKLCRFVTVRGIRIVNSPNYCVSLGGCEDVLIDAVVIRTAYSDGIDPDCCRRVRISNCDIEADDDALCLKASLILGAPRATEDVLVTNCRMRSTSNCFKLGTESSGDFRHIAVSNCVFSGLAPEDHDASAAAEGGGIAIESVDGGTIEDVTVANVVMHGVPAPIFIRLGARGRGQPTPVPGHIRNVSINGVVATGATITGSITGLRGHPVEAVTLDNVRIGGMGGALEGGGLDVLECEADYPTVAMFGTLPAFGLYVRHARDVVLRDVVMPIEQADSRAAVIADDVADLHLRGLAGGCRHGGGPFLWLHDVRGGLLQGNRAPAGVSVFARITGRGTKDVMLVGNACCTAAAAELGPEIAPEAVLQLANVGADARTARATDPARGT